jgi:anti-anti-sigma factor
MSITVETESGLSRVNLTGELTIFYADELWARLWQGLQEAQEVEIDLSGVSEIDTAGIQLLMMAKKTEKNTNMTVRVVNHSQSVLEAFEIYDLAGYFGDPLVLESA